MSRESVGESESDLLSHQITTQVRLRMLATTVLLRALSRE